MSYLRTCELLWHHRKALGAEQRLNAAERQREWAEQQNGKFERNVVMRQGVAAHALGMCQDSGCGQGTTTRAPQRSTWARSGCPPCQAAAQEFTTPRK